LKPPLNQMVFCPWLFRATPPPPPFFLQRNTNRASLPPDSKGVPLVYFLLERFFDSFFPEHKLSGGFFPPNFLPSAILKLFVKVPNPLFCVEWAERLSPLFYHSIFDSFAIATPSYCHPSLFYIFSGFPFPNLVRRKRRCYLISKRRPESSFLLNFLDCLVIVLRWNFCREFENDLLRFHIPFQPSFSFSFMRVATPS